jgi:hypothetical protein
MRASPTSAVLFAAFGLFATATITAAAQAGANHSLQIDHGCAQPVVEAPQTIRMTGDEVFRLRCVGPGSDLEL